MNLNEEDTFKIFLHQMNQQAKSLNKDIIQKSATMQDVPVQTEIYKKPKPKPNPQQVAFQQQQMLAAQQQQMSAAQQQQPLPQQVTGDPALMNSLLERVSSVEKQLSKFVNLIERRVAKNAKEINIRIKLNENNDSDNKE
tara:strand:- start:20 stop:439 length:420 start_codon:yes stop_codon:yes gene_type:complete